MRTFLTLLVFSLVLFLFFNSKDLIFEINGHITRDSQHSISKIYKYKSKSLNSRRAFVLKNYPKLHKTLRRELRNNFSKELLNGSSTYKVVTESNIRYEYTSLTPILYYFCLGVLILTIPSIYTKPGTYVNDKSYTAWEKTQKKD